MKLNKTFVSKTETAKFNEVLLLVFFYIIYFHYITSCVSLFQDKAYYLI